MLSNVFVGIRRSHIFGLAVYDLQLRFSPRNLLLTLFVDMRISFLLFVSTLLSGASAGGDSSCSGSSSYVQGCLPTVAVANRASGTVSVLDAITGCLIETIDMPPGPNPAEPMYVNSTPRGLVYVNDRANNRIAVFDSTKQYELVKLIPCGKGAFHTGSDQAGTVLWVVNDIEKSLTVIDMVHAEPIATIDVSHIFPTKKPHDLSVTWDARFAYVTFLGDDAGTDAIVKFDAVTYEVLEVNDNLAPDPHVSTTFRSNFVYVPQQGGNTVSLLKQTDLSEVDQAFVPNAVSKIHAK